MERTNDPKIVLLVRLLSAIDEGTHSFERLKERISDGERHPSTRSLRRYLAVLADAGFPWYFDRASNTYRFSEGYSLKRLGLSNSELFGLVALRAISASLKGAIGSYVDDVTEKMVGTMAGGMKERLKGEPPMTFHLSEIHLGEQGERVFGLLSSAERSTRCVSFSYEDKDGRRSKRTVDPYGFIVSGGRVYCVAHDHDRREKRTFALDSISGVDVLARTFTKPASFSIAEYAAASMSGVFHSEVSTPVRVRFAARVAKAALAQRRPDSEIARLEDGGVEISYAVPDLDEVCRWVLGWGAQAEIVEPQEARSRIHMLIAEIAAKYEIPVGS